ncbi:MAG: cytochrome B, partial [Rhodoferax sp.]
SEVVKVILIVLVALHIVAIVFYKVKKHTNLVTPMLSGDKEVASDLPATRDDAATRMFALGVLAACALAVWALLQWAAVVV